MACAGSRAYGDPVKVRTVLLGWTALGIVTIAAPFTISAQGRDRETVVGTVASCTVSSNAVVLELSSSGTPVRVEIGEKDRQAWPSAAYRAIVGDAYRIGGPCPSSGEHTRVFFCTRCDHPVVQGIELGGRGSSFNENARTLWIVRRFFDRKSKQSPDGEYWNYLIGSMLIARHNSTDGKGGTLWIRDRLGRALDAYSSNERAESMVTRFGEATFRDAVPSLRATYDRYADRVGLVKGTPYRPSDGRGSAPFVGSWPSFALEVYVEEKDGTLSKLYPDQSNRR